MTRTAQGCEALRSYRTEWGEKARAFKRTPDHNWASHGADTWRYLSIAWRAPLREPEPDPHAFPARTIQNGPQRRASLLPSIEYTPMTLPLASFRRKLSGSRPCRRMDNETARKRTVSLTSSTVCNRLVSISTLYPPQRRCKAILCRTCSSSSLLSIQEASGARERLSLR